MRGLAQGTVGETINKTITYQNLKFQALCTEPHYTETQLPRIFRDQHHGNSLGLEVRQSEYTGCVYRLGF